STIGSLNDVKQAARKEAELAKAVAEFKQRFQALEQRVETVRTQAVTTKARAKEHYEAWQKELTALQSAKIREKAQERFSESQKEFDKIIEEAATAKAEVLPFVSMIKDIAIYLDADLSKDAVESLSNDIWKLTNKTRSVNGTIGDLIEQIDRTLKSLP